MLDLPQVTLLFVETRAHKITKRVIDDAMSKINFGDILIYTDKPDLIPIEGARYIEVPDFPDKKSAGQFYYQFAMREVKTDFALMLEWDAGVKDVANWRWEFLDYDYIGAPWKVRPQEENSMDVGNGGFTLMSKRLGHFLAENQKNFPVYTDWDLCRNQRKHLEQLGFKWPRRDVATKFAWELTKLPPGGVFGFHATFTWPLMLPREEVVARARLMTETEYLTSKMPDLMKKAPWLEDELGAELFTRYREINPAYSPQGPARILSASQRQKMNHILTQRRELYRSQMQRAGLKA
jgi:hypothetical protein